MKNRRRTALPIANRKSSEGYWRRSFVVDHAYKPTAQEIAFASAFGVNAAKLKKWAEQNKSVQERIRRMQEQSIPEQTVRNWIVRKGRKMERQTSRLPRGVRKHIRMQKAAQRRTHR